MMTRSSTAVAPMEANLFVEDERAKNATADSPHLNELRKLHG
jgi:hypothetical protein